jgi:hypothetical protein
VEVVAVHGSAKLEAEESETPDDLGEMLNRWVLAEEVEEVLVDVVEAEVLRIAQADFH